MKKKTLKCIYLTDILSDKTVRDTVKNPVKPAITVPAVLLQMLLQVLTKKGCTDKLIYWKYNLLGD